MFLPSDIIPQGSLKILKIALFISQKPPKPQPIAVNTSHCIYSFALLVGGGRPPEPHFTIFVATFAYFVFMSCLLQNLFAVMS